MLLTLTLLRSSIFSATVNNSVTLLADCVGLVPEGNLPVTAYNFAL